MQWCRDSAQLIADTSHDAEVCARNSSICDIDDYTLMESDENMEKEQLYFVPAFSGLFAPHWKSDARGLLIGLTAFHTREHIVRAALESSAFCVMEVINAMNEDMRALHPNAGPGVHAPIIRVDGGMCKNKYLMQFQSNLLNASLHVPCNTANMTAMGAIFAACLGCGVYVRDTIEADFTTELRKLWQLSSEYNPHIHSMRRQLMVSIV